MNNKLVMVKIPYENSYLYDGDIILNDSDFKIGKQYEHIGNINNISLIRIRKIELDMYGKLPKYVISIHDGVIQMNKSILGNYFKTLREYNLEQLKI